MRRADGVLLDWDEIAVAEVLVRIAVAYLERRNGAAPDAALQLRDDLAASARRKPSPQASAGCGSADAAAEVVVADSPAEMTTRDAAAALGIGERRVRDLCKARALIATQGPAGRWVIDAGSAAVLAARRKGSRDD